MLERVLEPEVMDTVEEAESYDAMDHGEVNRAFATRAAEILPPGALVLDVGTGPARIPILVAELRPDVRLTAVDLAGEMLRVARRNVAEAGLPGRIRIEKGDAKRLLFPDASFDAVLCNTIVHHIPDPVPFFREVGRVLGARGGALLIRDLLRPENGERLEWIVRTYAGSETPYQQKLFRDSLHASFTLPEVEEMARQAGMRGVRVLQTSDRHWTIERAGREA